MYITRTLTVANGTRDERRATEDEVAWLSGPIVVLGEPGLGKTDLTRSLEAKLSGLRVTAGQFIRTQALARITPAPGQLLIIDGLDEITSTTGSAVDEVLGKLSAIGDPQFILSCRTVDWEGALGRHKIQEDYGVTPTVLHLEPMSIDDSRAFLSERLGKTKGEALIEAIMVQRLEVLAGNPLTLKLLAELAEDGQDLPRTRGELFERAAPLLLSEANKAHARRGPATVPPAVLLDAAGAIFAHLLLSGMSGIALSTGGETVDNFVPEVEVLALDARGLKEVMHTRLFRADSEHLLVPIHKSVAEYVAGKWLAAQIARGRSKRRVLQAFSSIGGVPSALRGMHAWLACSCSAVAEDCIKADPYGILRYGDVGRLAAPHIRALLNALSALAEEDPYFRSEDWGVAAVSGLARPELQDDIVRLMTSSTRPLHLSTLLLQAMKGTNLARAIQPILLDMMRSEDRPHIERHHAVENLAAGDLFSNWSAEIQQLAGSANESSRRLALEILQLARDPSISGALIAEVLVGYHGLGREERDRHGGIDYGLEKKLTDQQVSTTMDALGDRFAKQQEGEKHWNPHHRLASMTMALLCRAIDAAPDSPPERIWRWVRCIDCRRSYRDADRDTVRTFFERNDGTRRAIQRLAFAKPSMGETPWMAIVNDLPEVSPGLALTATDAVFYLTEIGDLATPNRAEIDLWNDIVQSFVPRRGLSDDLNSAVERGVTKHDALAERWRKMLLPPERDWEQEHAVQREQAAREQAEQYEQHRTSFADIASDIERGKNVAALRDLGKAYLGQYSDFPRELPPHERVAKWVGKDLAEQAERGFVAVLTRPDLPSAKQIVDARLQGQWYKTAIPMICGAIVMHRKGAPLKRLAAPTLSSLLVEWWNSAYMIDDDIRASAQHELEDLVLGTEVDIALMARLMIEPSLSAGRDDIDALGTFRQNQRFDDVLANLAIEWLSKDLTASIKVQAELLEIALERGKSREIAELVAARLPIVQAMTAEARRDWTAAGFASGAAGINDEAAALAGNDPELFWSIRRFISAMTSRDTGRHVDAAKRGEVVRLFAKHWPPAASPGCSWGDSNPHNATEYIIGQINALGTDPNAKSGDVLDRLATAPEAAAYREHIQHMRAQQRRARRDREYVAPSFEEIRSTLRAEAPGTIDDLKAHILDVLSDVQKYVRDGDTRGWVKFWSGERPLDEDGCRNRLLDDLRPRAVSTVTLLPESLMPERKRVDILALHGTKGLPIEIKGQWHPGVWDAASTQLEEMYTRDWRAFGRGIYLVFWFGPGTSKKITSHPDGLAEPSSPEQMRQMLAARMSASERSRIDVVVFDGSPA